jgi:hypothetical protein
MTFRPSGKVPPQNRQPSGTVTFINCDNADEGTLAGASAGIGASTGNVAVMGAGGGALDAAPGCASADA